MLCIGSINIDHYYGLPCLPEENKLVIVDDYQRCLGGKGLNQVLALRAAGYKDVIFAGAIGTDGDWVMDELDRLLPESHMIVRKDVYTGHVNILQVPSKKTFNSVILFKGANDLITSADILNWMESSQCQVLLMQNEIGCTPELLQIARERGMRVVLNSAPMHVIEKCFWRELGRVVEVLVLNRHETMSLYELLIEQDPRDLSCEDILVTLQKYIQCQLIIMTADKDGVYFIHKKNNHDVSAVIHLPAFDIELVDPTGAGDCFIGYFLAEYLSDHPSDGTVDIERCVKMGQAAAAECCLERGMTGVRIKKERVQRRLCQIK